MKKPIAAFLIMSCMFLFFAGTAFAGAAPDAASYFTHPGYNKTYTGKDGQSHTMRVTWVGETWNKLGTVIYGINYEDVYQRETNTYIDVMSATEIYENARPTYPDSPKHSVYQVKWYADGRKEIVSDYRPASPEQTPPQTAQPERTAAPTTPSPALAGPSPTPDAPSSTPAAPSPSTSAPSPKPAATDKSATKPAESATPKPAPGSTATPGNPVAPDSPAPLEETPALTSGPTPDVTAAQGNVTGVSAAPSPSASVPEEESERTAQDADSSHFRWIWPVIVLSGIGVAILLALYRRGKEKKDHEDREA